MNSYVKKQQEIIPLAIRSTISLRYKTVTKAMNREFWNSASDYNRSFYVGSYGRGTAVDTSDIDILVELPEGEYNRYDSSRGNGQSRLLQAVKEAIINSYPRSDVRADGQVVKIAFNDEMKFEVLPAFQVINNLFYWDGTYKYPDTNMGGNWKSTNPKAEQRAMKEKNDSSNGLLFDTCKHIRAIRDRNFSSYHLSGIVIDSFIYEAIGVWKWSEGESSSYWGDYEQHLLTYYKQMSSWHSYILHAPGSGMKIDTTDSMDCLSRVLNYMAD